jgi:hypothetical protein
MFSLNNFLIVSADQKNIYVRSDDGKQTYTILVFNINLSFVNGNLLKIKQVGTDQIITIPFRNIVEANQALKKLQEQIDILRDNTPFILEKGMQNYVDDKITNVDGDLSGIYATLSVFNDNFDNIFGTLSVVNSNFDNIFATLSVVDSNFDNIFATLSVIDTEVTNIFGTISDIQQSLLTNNYFGGIITGATAWTNNGDGSLTLPNLTVTIFDNPDWIAPLRLFNITGGTTGVDFPGLINNDTNYIYIDYNGGSPIYVVDTLDGAINDSNVLRYLTVYRLNNFLHILEYGNEGAGLANKLNNRIIQTERIIRESGVELGLSASGVVTISEGLVWNGTNRININSVDSTNDIFFSNYHVSGVWSFTTSNTTINNFYYDDGVDLVVASASKYLTNWYYRGLEVNDHIYEVVSRNQYDNVSEAQLSKVPPLTELITSHAFLVGRIIIEVGSQSGLIESAFNTFFQPSNVTSHADLNNLQGGGPGEYYHLTFNERDNLAFQNVDNNFSTNQSVGGYLSASTFYGDGSNLSGIFDTKVNNLEYSNPILTLSQNDGSSYSVTISTSDSYVTGLSFSGGVLSLGQTGAGQTFTASIPDIFVTGLTISNSNLTLEQNDGSSYSVTISTVDSYVTSLGFTNSILSLGQTGVGQTFTASIPDTFVTELNLVGNTLTLSQNQGQLPLSVTISGSDTYTTGATLSNTDIIFTRNDLATYSVDLSNLGKKYNKILFVDLTYGNDSIAEGNNIYRPFLTIASALATAVSGDLIVLNPGSYNETITLKDGVDFYAYPGVIITGIPLSDSGQITDAGVSVNCNIYGYMSLFLSTSLNSTSCIRLSGSNTNVNFELLDITKSESGSGSAIFSTAGGIVKISARDISSTGSTSHNGISITPDVSLSSNQHFINCESITGQQYALSLRNACISVINVKYDIKIVGSTGQFASVITTQSLSNSNSRVELNCRNIINETTTTYGCLVITGTHNGDVFINCDTIQSTNTSLNSASVSPYGGVLTYFRQGGNGTNWYINAKKILADGCLCIQGSNGFSSEIVINSDYIYSRQNMPIRWACTAKLKIYNATIERGSDTDNTRIVTMGNTGF